MLPEGRESERTCELGLPALAKAEGPRMAGGGLGLEWMESVSGLSLEGGGL